jgi:predicted nucleic acid-binding protein
LLQTFIDTNVFVYAFLKTKRKLQPSEESIKEAAKAIIARVSSGEEVLTSVVHFSEVCNILEDFLPINEAFEIEMNLLLQENILIKEVTAEDYLKALTMAEDYKVGANDSLAYVLMKEAKTNKIYSFDKDFDAFKDLTRVIQ